MHRNIKILISMGTLTAAAVGGVFLDRAGKTSNNPHNYPILPPGSPSTEEEEAEETAKNRILIEHLQRKRQEIIVNNQLNSKSDANEIQTILRSELGQHVEYPARNGDFSSLILVELLKICKGETNNIPGTHNKYCLPNDG